MTYAHASAPAAELSHEAQRGGVPPLKASNSPQEYIEAAKYLRCMDIAHQQHTMLLCLCNRTLDASERRAPAAHATAAAAAHRIAACGAGGRPSATIAGFCVLRWSGEASWIGRRRHCWNARSRGSQKRPRGKETTHPKRRWYSNWRARGGECHYCTIGLIILRQGVRPLH